MGSSLAAWFGATALFGIIATCWGTIKSWTLKIYGLLVVTISSYDSDFRDTSFSYLTKNFKRSKMSLDEYIHFTYNFIIPLKNKRHILTKSIGADGEIITFWKGFRFITFGAYNDKQKNTLYKISFLRLFFNKEKLLKELEEYCNTFNRQEENRFYIERFLGSLGEYKGGNNDGSPPDAPAEIKTSSTSSKFNEYLFWKKEDVGEPKKVSPIDCLALNEICLDAIKEAKRWINSIDWFKSKNIPFKRGWLMYGKPGTGKTSLVRAIAQEINVPIMVLDLSTMSNKDFSRAWARVVSNSPCIALIEDIDSVFNGRENISSCDGALSFDCLLNNLDGVQANDGIFTIITTNNLDKVDDAIGKPNGDNISTRPGRIDRTIEMTNPNEAGRLKIATRILNDFPESIDKTVKEGYHDTGAQFQERCARLALKLFWENKENKS